MTPTRKLATAACAAVIAAACGAATDAAAATKLRLSTYVNEIDIRYAGFKHFADLVKEKTDGRIEVEIHPSATLHGWAEGIDAVTGGVSDISWISYETRMPCYRAGAFYPADIDLDKQVEMDAEMTALLADEAAKTGLINVFSSNYSYDQEWWFKGPIESLGKLDGMQVRSIGPLVSAMITAWGGSPVFIAPKEVFQSAERGVVDGINMGVATYSSWKLWTVMPYMIDANLFYGNIMYMMNKAKFDGLPEADQKAILAAGHETEMWLKPRYEAWINEQVGDAVMKGRGSAVSTTKEETDRLIASVRPQWDEELDKTCGKETSDKIRALIAKYER